MASYLAWIALHCYWDWELGAILKAFRGAVDLADFRVAESPPVLGERVPSTGDLPVQQETRLAGEIAMTALGCPETRKHASGGPTPGYDTTRAAVTAGPSHDWIWPSLQSAN